MYISVYVCTIELYLGKCAVAIIIIMNKRYNCGYGSYTYIYIYIYILPIGNCYLNCGAEYSASYYMLYNVDQSLTTPIKYASFTLK